MRLLFQLSLDMCSSSADARGREKSSPHHQIGWAPGMWADPRILNTPECNHETYTHAFKRARHTHTHTYACSLKYTCRAVERVETCENTHATCTRHRCWLWDVCRCFSSRVRSQREGWRDGCVRNNCVYEIHIIQIYILFIIIMNTYMNKQVHEYINIYIYK